MNELPKYFRESRETEVIDLQYYTKETRFQQTVPAVIHPRLNPPYKGIKRPWVQIKEMSGGFKRPPSMRRQSYHIADTLSRVL